MAGPQLIAAWLLLTGLLVANTARSATAEEVDPPVTVALTIIDLPRNTRVVGEFVSYDEVGPTLIVGSDRRRYTWAQLTPTSCFIARHRIIDEDDPQAWLELAEFGRRVGARRQAENALKTAVKLDPSLEAEADAIRDKPLADLRRPGVADDKDPTAPAETATDATPEPVLDPFDATLPPKFAPVTPAEAAAAERMARGEAEQTANRLGVRLREISTPHFLIFTDWEAVDDEWLSEQLELAYELLCREFDVPADQPVFIGRLPVYMYDRPSTMLRHAHDIDRQTHMTLAVAGYFSARSDGLGKMVMSKPLATPEMGLTVARKLWSRTLTHEFVHAFLARYRGNRFLPRWLNEGVAEMIAEMVYPRFNALEIARNAARSRRSISLIFNDDNLPTSDYYPVMMTLVVAMYREDPAKFVRMVDRIKVGHEPEQVLQDLYDVDYAGLEEAWRQYMQNN